MTEWVKQVPLSMCVWPDASLRIWISYCPVLDIYSQGTTESEAMDALESAVSLWLKHAEPRLIAPLLAR